MIRGLILAAGSGSRFGQNKLLACLPNGQPIALASAMSMRGVVDGISAVLNPESETLTNLFLSEQISILSCSQSRLGIGHSIACGVTSTEDAQGWIIALADMPFIKTSTIEAVVSTLRKGALIAAPIFAGKRGHPVGFSRDLYSELVALKGDIGARALLKQYSSQVVEIECDDLGIHIDIDIPTDLEKYSRELFGPVHGKD